MVRKRESVGHMDISPPGMEMGQLAKKLGCKEKCMDSRHLPCSTIITLPGKMPDMISVANQQCFQKNSLTRRAV